MTKRPNLPPIQQNIIDKAIAYFAPRVAARRFQARTVLALAGGYSGAKLDRSAMAAWKTTAGGSPETDVIIDLPMLRDRSADLDRNNPVAASVINTSATHVVGTGLSCTPHIDAEFLKLTPEQATAWQVDTRRRFKAWSESKDCDLARVLNFYGVQDQALRGTMTRGDIFVVTPRVQRSNASKVKLALQLVEADRVSNPRTVTDTETMTDGVECDPNTGEAIAYHVASKHPSDFANKTPLEWKRVAARGDKTGRLNVIHLFKQLRPGLRRGVPILAPVIEPLKQLGTYSTAELQAAVTSGLFSVFVKMDPAAFEDMFDEKDQATIVERGTKWSGQIEAGQAVNLLPGESVETSNPGRPNAQFDAFTSSCMRQIGMAIGIPYEVLVMHYQSSYSAARGALLTAWRFFMGWRDWLATNLCQPVYEIWLADEVASGRISAAGFFSDEVVRCAWCAAQWVGDGPGSIDPTKEVDAASKRVALGISTLQAESILYDGVDWETKHRQSVKELQQREADGLPPPGQLTPPPAPPPEPDESEDPPGPPPPGPSDDTKAIVGGIMALAQRPAEPTVNHFHMPAVSIQPPAVQVDNHFEPPNIEVSVAGDTHNIALSAPIDLKAEIRATLEHPGQKVIDITRDENNEAVRMVETYLKS